MMRSFPPRVWTLLCFLVVSAASALAQEPQIVYEPQVGQPGKDVVWVPTDDGLVGKMLDLAQVTPQDYVIDLGSGDGRTVIAAARRGARAHGIEFNPDMVDLSIRNAAEAGVSGKATFVKADLFESDFSGATVITMFLLPDINLKLRPRLLDLKPGTRVVSNSFTMEEWQPDGTASMEGECLTWCTAYLWIIPAKVEGAWSLEDGQLELNQQFQIVKGAVLSGGKRVPVVGRIDGEKIDFHTGETEYVGVVRGDTMSGTIKTAAGERPFHAKREAGGQSAAGIWR